MNLKTVLSEVKAYIIITAGLLCYVLGWDIFLIPNNLVGGGVSGISAILLYAFDIPISISFFIINLVLLLIALKILGKNFGVKTVYAIIITSVFFDVVPRFLPDVFIQEIAISNGKLLCSIFGGVFAGFGIGVCFSQGGSTGGTDIIAAIVNKYRDITLGRVILICDVIIISSSYLVLHDWEKVVYGYVVLFISSFVLDQVVNSARQSVQFFIISQKYEEIGKRINKDLHRGVTFIDGVGCYTHNNVKMMFVLAKKRESNTIFRLIKDIDPNAFVSQSAVIGVFGEGFDKIKVK